ncbi:MAG: class I SAM-dependent methyltransferase [Phototrophicales bacterium]|nr:class I SAM-dependent methyltransferase [Phototrophicales bacterium]
MFADDVILPNVYDRIGMADYSAKVTPKLVNFAQRNEWAGRRILDLGCGTGASTLWFSSFGYNVTSLDYNAAMLQQLKSALDKKGHTATLVQADVRQLPPVTMIDMVLALNLFNELDSLRDLETSLKQVSAVLSTGRFFIFDMYTLEGLAQRGAIASERLYEADDLTVFAQRQYDYDRQLCTIEYDMLMRQNGDLWNRAKTKRLLRAYPIMAIVTLVRRMDFELVSLLDTQLNVVDVANHKTTRVVFVLKKQ